MRRDTDLNNHDWPKRSCSGRRAPLRSLSAPGVAAAPLGSIIRSGLTAFGVLFILAGACFGLQAVGPAAASPSKALQRGRSFLLNLLDRDLGLMPEYRGANVYWLLHDNYLAAKLLARSDPKIAQRILSAIRREGVYEYGRIGLIFGEDARGLPFHESHLVEVRRVGHKVIRTEKESNKVIGGWEDYADLLLLACIAEGNRPAARRDWTAAMRFWDGKGFLDAAARHDGRYATYKLALALIAASRLSPRAQPPEGLLDRLLAMQGDSGGWITDYDASGKGIGVANVETTCLAILGIEALAPGSRHSDERR